MSGLPEFDFTSGTALVTGAASGIGEQLAQGLAARGSALVLLDRDAEGLAEVAAQIGTAHPSLPVQTLVVDLADRAGLGEVARQLATDHPDLTLLVNNAGVALGGRFDQLTLEEFDWVMAVNFGAPVTLTHALLPLLKTHPGSHIVNVSSIFGIIGPAGQSAYSSSKFALRGFSEVLRAELAEDAVGVTVVHPGGIRTQHRPQRADRLPRARGGHPRGDRRLRPAPELPRGQGRGADPRGRATTPRQAAHRQLGHRPGPAGPSDAGQLHPGARRTVRGGPPIRLRTSSRSGHGPVCEGARVPTGGAGFPDATGG